MPKVQQRNPFETIEAPSTARLNGDRLTEELFHLERTISRGELWQQDITDSLDRVDESNGQLKESVDTLIEKVTELTEMLAGACRLMRKLLEQQSGISSGVNDA